MKKITNEKIILSYAVLLFFVFFFNPFSEILSFKNYLIVFSSFFPIYFAYKAYKFFGIKNYQGKSMFFIGLSMFFGGLGRFILISESLNNLISADIFFIFLRPFFGLGIFFALKTINPEFYKDKKTILPLAFIGLAVSIIYVFLFQLKLNFNSYEKSLYSVYILLDAVLIAFVVIFFYLAYLVRKGLYKMVWLHLAIGAIFFGLSQSYYIYNPDSYVVGTVFDLGWGFGFLLFATAINSLLVLTKKIISISKKKKN